jgi:hypothetical protein
MMVAEIVGGLLFGSIALVADACLCQRTHVHCCWPRSPTSTLDATLRIHAFRSTPASSATLLGLRARKRCAAELKRSPGSATADEARRFQRYLIESRVNICNRNRIMPGADLVSRQLRRHEGPQTQRGPHRPLSGGSALGLRLPCLALQDSRGRELTPICC